MGNTSSKKISVQLIFAAVFVVILIRLAYLQIIDDSFRELAKDRIFRKETLYPERGLVYDRNGKLIVYNEPVYNLMVIPNQISDLDTNRFCKTFGITRDEFNEKIRKAKRYSVRHSSLVVKDIPADTFATFEEYMHLFPGFFAERRTNRHYPFGTAAHLLGYVSEVGESDIIKSEYYYKSGDLIGRTGIEKSYEQYIRGERGCKYIIVDVYNRPAGKLNNGDFDTLAISGSDIITSLDIDLQNYGEELMKDKKGAIVAIEPGTGEILALLSAPSYNPNLLVGNQRTRNFNKLSASGKDPINNRALKGFYPPGSTFKPIMALIALQDSVISKNFYYPCHGGYKLGRRRVGCHNHPPPSNVHIAVKHSCNAYFCATFDRFIDNPLYDDPAIGFQHWRDYMLQFGLGQKLNIDLPNEFGGNVPTKEVYDKAYGEGRWKASNIITLGIGQDKLIITPLQLANMASILANKGQYYTPHVVKKIEGNETAQDRYKISYITPVDRSHFDLITEALADVVKSGTGRMAAVPDLEVCGKTGTVENPHGEDHSVFIAYAPKENPKIAIAVLVENSGFGSTWAAPISGLMIEKYLRGEISESKNWVQDKMMGRGIYAKVGEEE